MTEMPLEDLANRLVRWHFKHQNTVGFNVGGGETKVT